MDLKNTSILIVEDDESICLGLKMNLEAEGYLVTTRADGRSGYTAGLDAHYDLIILDVMLPKENGIEVLRKWRKAKMLSPVIMLSARSAETDKVMGLEYGAEDYITKPFGLAELLARVRAVLRRDRIARVEPLVEVTRVEAGRLVIDSKIRTVVKGGDPVELTATEFDVLWCLAGRDTQVFSREAIQHAVWGPEHHGTLRTIDNFLLQLRNKLEDDPAQPAHLLTVRGVGYRFSDGNSKNETES